MSNIEPPKIQSQLRMEVLLRDKATCQECGFVSVNGKGMHLHHVVPRKDGGADEAANLLTLCRPCHQEHHNSGPRYIEPKPRTIRLDDDVWEALREMGESPNRYLRRMLLGGKKGGQSVREPLLKPSEKK